MLEGAKFYLKSLESLGIWDAAPGSIRDLLVPRYPLRSRPTTAGAGVARNLGANLHQP